jgi:hypothetical protein
VKPKPRTKFYGNRRFDVSAASLWNSFTAVLRLKEILTSFKMLLKTHLFQLAFYNSSSVIWMLFRAENVL